MFFAVLMLIVGPPLLILSPFLLVEFGQIAFSTALIAEAVLIVLTLLILYALSKTDSFDDGVYGYLVWIGVCVLLYFFAVKPYIRIHNGCAVQELLNEEVRGGKGVNGPVYHISGEWLSVQHKFFFFIPTYKDHYYFAFNDEMTKCIAVRAKSGWAGQFDENGSSENGVTLKGYVQKFSLEGMSPSLESVLSERIQYWNSVGFYPEVDTVYYVETRPFFNLATVFSGIDLFLDALGD